MIQARSDTWAIECNYFQCASLIIFRIEIWNLSDSSNSISAVNCPLWYVFLNQTTQWPSLEWSEIYGLCLLMKWSLGQKKTTSLFSQDFIHTVPNHVPCNKGGHSLPPPRGDFCLSLASRYRHESFWHPSIQIHDFCVQLHAPGQWYRLGLGRRLLRPSIFHTKKNVC